MRDVPIARSMLSLLDETKTEMQALTMEVRALQARVRELDSQIQRGYDLLNCYQRDVNRLRATVAYLQLLVNSVFQIIYSAAKDFWQHLNIYLSVQSHLLTFTSGEIGRGRPKSISWTHFRDSSVPPVLFVCMSKTMQNAHPMPGPALICASSHHAAAKRPN